MLSFLSAFRSFEQTATFEVELLLVNTQALDVGYLNAEIAGQQGVRVVRVSAGDQFYATAQALTQLRSQLIATLDPDMASNLADLSMMRDAIQRGALLVYGNRQFRTDVGFLRRRASALYNLILRRYFGSMVHDINTPMVMMRLQVASMLSRYDGSYGHPKLYFPFVLGDKFQELPVVVRSARKISSYSWLKLFFLALSQLSEAKRFRRHRDRVQASTL